MADGNLPASRREAKAKGARRYFTGNPCKAGHVAERMIGGQCVECQRAKGMDYYRKCRDDPRFKAQRAALRKRSRGRTQKYRERQRELVAGRPKPDRCEACGKPDKLEFDHCHWTGRFRGWLCGPCNRVLGSAGDDPALLRLLADYLERHHETLVQSDWIERERSRKVLGKKVLPWRTVPRLK